MPVLELRELPRRRSYTHKLACVEVVPATPEISTDDFYKHLCGENPFSPQFLQSLTTPRPAKAVAGATADDSPVEEISPAAASSEVISGDVRQRLAGKIRYSAEFLDALLMQKTKSAMKHKTPKPKHLAFDETQNHPERPSINPDREQFPCSYLTNDVERESWEVQTKVSHKVAVMKAMLVVKIVNETLIEQWCDDTYDEVQMQGVVTDLEEMEFNFVDSRSSWTYDSPDHIVEEILTSANPQKGTHGISAATTGGASVCAVSRKYEPLGDECVPNLPPALWLMDIGCGHDLIND